MFLVEDILSVNDRTFSMSIELRLTMMWKDERIKMSPNISELNLPEEFLTLTSVDRKLLWVPSFSMGHLISFDKLGTLDDTESIRVEPLSGTDFLLVHQGTYVVQMKCPMEFNTFPFDTHTCYFEVRSCQRYYSNSLP